MRGWKPTGFFLPGEDKDKKSERVSMGKWRFRFQYQYRDNYFNELKRLFLQPYDIDELGVYDFDQSVSIYGGLQFDSLIKFHTEKS